MLSEQEVIGLQAEKHELVTVESATTLEAYNLFLIHKKAYELVAQLADGLRVLDLGCNTGYGTDLIARTALSVTGLDVSPRAIAEGERLYPHLDLRVGDGRSLPYGHESFDLVASFQVIEHVADPDRFLAEVKRVLTPFGRLALTTPNAAIRLQPGMKPWNRFHVREYRATELQQLLQRHFRESRVEGLVADEPLYSVELQRVARLMESSLRKRSKWYRLRSAFAHRTRPAGIGTRELQPSDLERYTTAAFRYETDGSERALDLLALCSEKR